MGLAMGRAQAAVATFVPFLGPAFLVSVGYMDPGNWATAIEGGSRFGYELVWVVVVANVMALFLQTLAARLGLVTGKHLAQICREEYPKATSLFMWILCEMSVVAQDLTMVLGTAIGLDLLLHFPMLSSIFLMAADAVLYLMILPLLGVRKAEMASVCVIGLVLLCFVLHILLSNPPIAAVMSGMVPRLRRESLYTVVSLFGANIMPHNLYLHSSLLQGQRVRWRGSFDVLCRYNFVDIAVAFGAALIVNLVVLMVAATTFHNAGLVVLTLQDAHALMEHILDNAMAPAVFGLALVCAGQLSAFTGTVAGQVALEGFLQAKMHGWVHRFCIRLTAIIPAAVCVWRTGSQGTYQLLIFSQVFLALQLPFTVVPLIKVTSSGAHMGAHKNSAAVKFLAWITVGIVFFLDIWLVSDMLFGESDEWVNFASWETVANLEWWSLTWAETGQAALFSTMLVTVFMSVGFLVWMIITPLRVESQELRRQLWIEEYEMMQGATVLKQEGVTGSDTSATQDHSPCAEHEQTNHEKSAELHSSQCLASSQEGSLSRGIVEPIQGLHGYAVPSKSASNLSLEADPEPEVLKRPPVVSCDDCFLEESLSSPSSTSTPGPSPLAQSPAGSILGSVGSKSESLMRDLKEDDMDSSTLKHSEAEADAEVGLDADLDLLDTHEEADVWENLGPEEVVLPGRSGSHTSLVYEGPGSGRSVGGRSDTSEGSGGGSGSGSLSRLSGLGRAARRQFAAILDEFWGNIFDLHGQPVGPPSSKHGTAVKQRQQNGYERGDLQSFASRQPKKSWQTQAFSDQLGRMDAYLRAHTNAAASTSSRFGLSPDLLGRSGQFRNERPYSSMKLPASREEYDHQPATIHGYQSISFMNRSSPSSSPVSPRVKARPMYLDMRYSRESGQSNVVIPDDSSLGPSEYEFPRWSPLVSRATGRWDPLVSRATGELDMRHQFDSVSQWTDGTRPAAFSGSAPGQEEFGAESRVPLAFDEISPTRSSKEGFSTQPMPASGNQSLWSTQPFEQLFGTTESSLDGRIQTFGMDGAGRPSVPPSGNAGATDFEVEMLESFKACIVKLSWLEGSDWLFRFDSGGSDQDLIATIAAHQRLASDSLNRMCSDQQHWQNQGRSVGVPVKNGPELSFGNSAVPRCGDQCVWSKGLLLSFGVWCVHRVLELSVMESRPELWGKYTYVLNRLQGILEPAFGKPRLVPLPCLCLQEYGVLENGVKRTSIGRQGSVRDYGGLEHINAFPPSNGYSPKNAHGNSPWGQNTACAVQGKGASASMFLDIIRDVELAVGHRKGRTGTAAGDVAFPKGKENLASVLKRYKRRLSNKPPGAAVGQGTGAGGGGVGGGAGRRGGFTPLFFAASVCICTVMLFPGPLD